MTTYAIICRKMNDLAQSSIASSATQAGVFVYLSSDLLRAAMNELMVSHLCRKLSPGITHHIGFIVRWMFPVKVLLILCTSQDIFA